MTEMTAIERIEKHINLEEPDRVAIAPYGGYYYATLDGMSCEDYLMDVLKSEGAFERGFNRHGGLDMAEVGMDVSNHLDPSPNGFSTFYFDWHLPGRERPPDAIPNLIERARDDPLMAEDDYDLLLREGFHRFFSFRRAGVGDLASMAGEARQVIELRRKWRDQYHVPSQADGLIEDPINLLSQLRGSTNFMLDLYRRPEKVLEVADRICDGLIAAGLSLSEMLESTRLIMGGSRASADFMSPKMFEKFALPFLVRTAHAAHEAGYELEYHMDLNWTPMLEYLKELPPKSGYLHLDERTDIIEAKKALGDHLCLKGNLKPSLFVLGTEEGVERAVKRIIDGCAAGGGLIISAELTADARFELVDKMIQVTKTYGAY
jgi:hypothetical protein